MFCLVPCSIKPICRFTALLNILQWCGLVTKSYPTLVTPWLPLSSLYISITICSVYYWMILSVFSVFLHYKLLVIFWKLNLSATDILPLFIILAVLKYLFFIIVRSIFFPDIPCLLIIWKSENGCWVFKDDNLWSSSVSVQI